jgi:hypothetical protein
MPDSVTLRVERDGSNALTTVTISTGWGQTIVFNEGTYYPPIHGTSLAEPSREYGEYVVVRTENLPLLADRLGIEGAPIEQIFAAVVEVARADGVDGLAAVRRMLDGLGVAFEESTWISYD